MPWQKGVLKKKKKSWKLTAQDAEAVTALRLRAVRSMTQNHGLCAGALLARHQGCGDTQTGQVQVVTATRSRAGTWPPLYMGQMETPDPLTRNRDPRGKSQSGCLNWFHPRSILSRRVLCVGIAARPASKCWLLGWGGAEMISTIRDGAINCSM